MDDVQKPPAVEVTVEERLTGHGKEGLYPLGDERTDVATEGQLGGDVAAPDDAEVLGWIKDQLIDFIGSDRTSSSDKKTAARLLRRIAEEALNGPWNVADRSFLWFITHRRGISDAVSTATLRVIARASTILAELDIKKPIPIE